MKSIFLKSILLTATGAFILHSASAKSLTVYFSRAGENYGVGEVQEGNTAKLAKIIAQKTNSDLYAITPLKEYPKEYKATTEIARTEKESNARPQYKISLQSVADYDTVYLGSPIWYGDMPMIMYSFLDKNSLDGKEIYPFITQEGSGLSAVDLRLQAMFKKAKIGKALVMKGTLAQKANDEVKNDVDAWLKEISK